MTLRPKPEKPVSLKSKRPRLTPEERQEVVRELLEEARRSSRPLVMGEPPGPEREPPPMKRANYLPAPAVFNLNAACSLVNEALGSFGCYLVGSSIRRRDYRDVDVRYIMEDAEFDRLFPGALPGPFMLHPLWSLMCTSISTWLRQQTGLTVDFQIQRMTQANEEYGRDKGHGREPLGVFLHPNPADQDQP